MVGSQAEKKTRKTTKENIELGLRFAGSIILRLPKSCPYSLSCQDDAPAELEIPCPTVAQYWRVAKAINCFPKDTSKEMRARRGPGLKIIAYLDLRPELAALNSKQRTQHAEQNPPVSEGPDADPAPATEQ